MPRAVAAVLLACAVLQPRASGGEEQNATAGAAENSTSPPGSPGYRNASDEQQLDLLRIQIGVPTSDATARAQPAAATSTVTPVAAPEHEEARAPAEPSERPRAQEEAPVRRAASKPRLDVARPAHDSRSAQSPPQMESPPAPQPARPRWSFDNSELGITETDLPPEGSVVDGSNEERWSHLLTPGLRWALKHGVSMQIVSPRPIPLEPVRAAATERYHAQVRLAADKRSLENYVAGIPFPAVKEDDPDLANKLVWNQQSRIIWDDLDLPKFGCAVERLDAHGAQVERDYRIGDFRRLFYVGRMVVDPKPTWPTPDGVRYREMVDAIEPFEAKGNVFSYNRYQDPSHDDDGWLYFSQARRVRRLSTSQRSEGVFGIDIDLDSYYGFAGNPAWFEWKMLGKKTLLAPFHASHEPPQPCKKPGDFMFCDAWEPREVYVLSAKSLIPGYNFSRRILYVDAQSNLIPYNEVYDLDGQLWRTLVLQWKAGLHRSMPYSKEAYAYKDETIFVGALLVYDMQQSHATYCNFPANDMAVEESAYYWRGSNGSTTPEVFDVAAILAASR